MRARSPVEAGAGEAAQHPQRVVPDPRVRHPDRLCLQQVQQQLDVALPGSGKRRRGAGVLLRTAGRLPGKVVRSPGNASHPRA